MARSQMKLQQIQEAKYAGSYSQDEVYKKYRDIAHIFRQDRYRVTSAGASKNHPVGGGNVVLDILLTNSFLSRGEARRFVRDTFKSQGLPYTTMDAKHEDGDRIFVQVTYKS